MEKMKKTKGYEPPDINFLQKDFETCVLSGDIECQYIEGTDVEDYPGTLFSYISFWHCFWGIALRALF